MLQSNQLFLARKHVSRSEVQGGFIVGLAICVKNVGLKMCLAYGATVNVSFRDIRPVCNVNKAVCHIVSGSQCAWNMEGNNRRSRD